MAAKRRNRRDDDDSDLAIRKKGNNAVIILAVTGACGILLVCLLACVVGAIVAFMADNTAEKIVGSWRGRFSLGPVHLDVVYIFNKDGSFRQESFDRFGRRVFSDGRWRYRDGKIEIDWNNGSFERATATWIDDNTMAYRIVDHSQAVQVGLATTFRRP